MNGGDLKEVKEIFKRGIIFAKKHTQKQEKLLENRSFIKIDKSSYESLVCAVEK